MIPNKIKLMWKSKLHLLRTSYVNYLCLRDTPMPTGAFMNISKEKHFLLEYLL